MAATLVDSNVLVDSFDPHSSWRPWADRALVDALDDGVLFINQIIYAEVSVAFATVEPQRGSPWRTMDRADTDPLASVILSR